MIFVFAKSMLLLKNNDPKTEDDFCYSCIGDVCLVLKSKPRGQRSLLLHPVHGPVYSFTTITRGKMYNVDGSK